MKILDQFNFFWQKHPEYAFTPLEIAVYAYLLNICNTLGRKNPFNLSKERLLFEMRLKTEKPLDTARLRLRQAGLLEFEKGNGRGKTTLYTITPAPTERGELNSPLLAADTPANNRKSPPERGQLDNALSGGLPAERVPERGQLNSPDKGGTTKEKRRGGSTSPEVKKEAAQKVSDFALFWDAYGKKVGKDTALKKWAALAPDEHAAILAHVPAYVGATPEKQFRKDPTSYLHQRTWLDEELPPPRHGQRQAQAAPVADAPAATSVPEPNTEFLAEQSARQQAKQADHFRRHSVPA